MQKLTVGEAAERLQISEQAVRKRLQRGTLPHAKQDGHVYVYLDSETSTVGQKEGKESDRQTTLNYLDKVYTAYQAISGGYNRFAFLTLAVSVVVLALSGGAVSTADELTVSGIGLRIPFVVFMTTGAILPAIFVVIIGNLEWLRFVYRRDIDRIYENLKLDDLSWNLPADPFRLVGVLDALAYTFAKEVPTRDDRNRPVGTALKPRGAGPIYIVLVLIVPTAAQAGAGYKISQLLDKADPGWLSNILNYLWLPRQGASWVSELFVILAFATAILNASGGLRMSKAMAEAGGDPHRTKIEVVFTYLGMLFLAYLGVRLGYFVAVR